MIERPDISDEKIVSALREHYLIPVVGAEFLPVGNDASAWAYRINAENQDTYFLKIRKSISNRAGFLVPRYLEDHGLAQVLAPLPTQKQELWIGVDDFFFILYPFVIGKPAMEVGMSAAQWTEFGSTLKRIHVTRLPSSISQYVNRETFIPKWSRLVKKLHKDIHERDFDDPYQEELATFWKAHNETIQTLVEQAELIGRRLQQADLKFVLCHADIHTANILLTQNQNMFIVDWDDTLLAPQERDLMFVLGEGTMATTEEQWFSEGYGDVKLNRLAVAYYRYEWCVQEIGDFGERVFLRTDLGEETKKDSIKGFMQLFSHGDVVETALTMPMNV
jgi:spectinomycin phosphotransferase